MAGVTDAREERPRGWRVAAALATVGLASFQGTGLLHYHLFRSGGDFDRNFLTLALLEVEEVLGCFPSLLLAGLLLCGGVSTFVHGALRAPFGKAAGLAGSVLFTASFLALAGSPAYGGWVGTHLGESVAALVGRWAGVAIFGASVVLAFGVATGRLSTPAGERGEGALVAEAGRPKSEGEEGRYGAAEGGGNETSAVNRSRDRRTEGHEDGGVDAHARRGGSDRRGGAGLRPAAGVPDLDRDESAVPAVDPGGSARRGRHSPGDVDRRRGSARPDAEPAEEPGRVETDTPAERPPVAGGERRVGTDPGAQSGPRAADRKAVDPGGGTPDSHPVRGEDGEFVAAAADAVFEAGRASVSVLQGRLRVPFLRASRLLERLERLGLVAPYRGGSARDILLTRAEWEKRPRGA